MSIFLPETIRRCVEGHPYREENIGMSDSRVLMFDDMVLKIEKDGSLTARQSTMLHWLRGKLPVPEILEEELSDGIRYTLMTRIRGMMSCAEECMLTPEKTVSAIAEGLHLLWSVNIESCPRTYSFDDMLADAERRLPQIDRSIWEGHYSTPEQQLCRLYENKPDEDFVFAHGDYCMPNVMLIEGRISGFIDLGQCGAADRWYDIALMQQSLARNFSGFFGGRAYDGYRENMLLHALEIKSDKEKLSWHQLLDELY